MVRISKILENDVIFLEILKLIMETKFWPEIRFCIRKA